MYLSTNWYFMVRNIAKKQLFSGVGPKASDY